MTQQSEIQEKRIYVNWGGQNVRLTWLPSEKLPPVEKITSVHGYCFKDDLILLVNVNGRGLNIPGGHVDEGETPLEAFHREVYEEGYVIGNARLLGMIEISHEENPLFDPNGKYPLVGYQVFYRMDITSCEPFQRENETTGRIWVEASEIPYVMDDHELAIEVLKEALKS